MQTPLFLYFIRFEVHYAHFGRHDHHAVFRDQVACRAQAVAIEHSSGIPSVAEKQGGRAVPRFHQDGMIFVERFQVFRYRVLFVETFRDQHRHGMWQAHAGRHEEFQHVVQRSAVAHIRLDDRAYLVYIRDAGRGQDAFTCFHPATVAPYRIDFPVVCQEAKRLC